jgi:hypothetical protein
VAVVVDPASDRAADILRHRRRMEVFREAGAEADSDLFYDVDYSGADLSHQAAVFVDVAFPRLPRLDCCGLGAAGERAQPVTRAKRNTNTAM